MATPKLVATHRQTSSGSSGGTGRLAWVDAVPGNAILDVDALIAPHLAAALDALDGSAPLLSGMARYHFGLVNDDLTPAPSDSTRASQGKRMRPAVALLCCAAAGGNPMTAAPLAAAIEILHQFTLVHDDIQDESPTRRHRPTVWTLWGVGQAINGGDALFAAAHLALYRLRLTGADPKIILRLAEAFDRMTIEIVRGQVLDLGFEVRKDVTPDDYLEMIAGKTSAIVEFGAHAGSLLAGVGESAAGAFARFGLCLGIGFQIQDDALGIWGATETTGKAAADDIRRRKQSLPIVLLRSVVDDVTRTELDQLYRADQIGTDGIAHVLALLAAHGIREQITERVGAAHDTARDALLQAALPGDNPARDALLAMVDSLADRDH